MPSASAGPITDHRQLDDELEQRILLHIGIGEQFSVIGRVRRHLDEMADQAGCQLRVLQTDQRRGKRVDRQREGKASGCRHHPHGEVDVLPELEQRVGDGRCGHHIGADHRSPISLGRVTGNEGGHPRAVATPGSDRHRSQLGRYPAGVCVHSLPSPRTALVDSRRYPVGEWCRATTRRRPVASPATPVRSESSGEPMAALEPELAPPLSGEPLQSARLTR